MQLVLFDHADDSVAARTVEFDPVLNRTSLCFVSRGPGAIRSDPGRWHLRIDPSASCDADVSPAGIVCSGVRTMSAQPLRESRDRVRGSRTNKEGRAENG